MPGDTESLLDLEQREDFIRRHIGPSPADQQLMLASLGLRSLEELVEQAVPRTIHRSDPLPLPAPSTEAQVLTRLEEIAGRNRVRRSLIGLGYYNCHTPAAIRRNLFENPAWYTAYTPYQPEISQGRLEALLNFQTMVAELAGMELANASLLDEATAAAEAMTLLLRQSRGRRRSFFVASDCFPQTLQVLRTRAEPLGIELLVGDPLKDYPADGSCFGLLLQYPGRDGDVRDYRQLIATAHQDGALVAVAADLLALTLLVPPGEMGADVVVGNSQRFGVPLGFGGPHAAYLATREAFKRAMPGRLVGVSRDSRGEPAYRLALQTREQHIRREKATSNICTAQVLLAVMAGMYAVHHGPEGLRTIARRVHRLARLLAAALRQMGYEVPQHHFFDTLTVNTGGRTAAIHQAARDAGFNLRQMDDARLGLSLDETIGADDLATLLKVFGQGGPVPDLASLEGAEPEALPGALRRTSPFLTHPVFHEHRSETGLLRYLRRLADRDIALDRAMIPLGSCTMKLNAAAEMIPVSWPAFAHIHPFAPDEDTEGYRQLIRELEQMLCACTGYDAVSLQPNSGAQGEYAGLLAIRAYHASRGEAHRDVCLIPSSAHGTNPASAHMAGMEVVVVACDPEGNVDLEDLRARAERHSERLAAIMITYPSTHGVFEERIRDICELVHSHGGQVYMDGANLNAQVGLAAPGKFGCDVSHLNLHKTFCIPHGGGGPGVGPVAVRSHLAPFLPGRPGPGDRDDPVGPVSAAPWGSAGILPISWVYISLMGARGLRLASAVAILNANYVARRLRGHYPVLYTGANGLVAHECIIDLRPIKHSSGITVDDVAKRLIDYGFHAPTMSFPVAGTLMIEPTESESRAELDRFCDAMIRIREEIAAVECGEMDPADNPLVNAPHTADILLGTTWEHPYERQQAAYPTPELRSDKYWPPVGRIDNVYGDRHLFCSCPPVAALEEPSN